MTPTPWDGAGAAPYNNIIGSDPALRDPEHGDFHSDRAPDYGSRIIPDPARPADIPPGLGTPTDPIPIRDPGSRDVGGEISADTTWDSAVIRVIGNVTITNGARLTIAAGTEVRFAGYHGLLVVDGTVLAVGTPAAPIVWTSETPGNFAVDLSDTGCWNGITWLNVPDDNAASELRWCDLACSKALAERGLDTREPRVGGNALEGAGGVLRFVGRSPVVVSHCVFHDNLAPRGGVILTHYGAAPVIANCLFHDNYGLERTSVVLASYSTPHLVQNTMTANQALAASTYTATGAVDNFQSRTRMTGNIIYGNPTNFYEDTQVLETRAYFCRWNDIGGFGEGIGGLDVAPDFVLGGSHPYALNKGSKCIDAGDHAAVAQWLQPLDLAGDDRLQDAEIDLGAYEGGRVSATPEAAPAQLSLRAAPNPFNPRTTLSFDLPEAAAVDLAIFDGRGRCVRRIDAGERTAGAWTLTWDGRDEAGRTLPAGLYHGRLSARSAGGLYRQQIKLTLLK